MDRIGYLRDRPYGQALPTSFGDKGMAIGCDDRARGTGSRIYSEKKGSIRISSSGSLF